MKPVAGKAMFLRANKTKSLKRQLNLALLVLLVPIWLLQGVVLDAVLRHVYQEDIRDRLEQNAQMLLAQIVVESNGMISLPAEFDSPLHFEQVFSGHYYIISGPENTLRSRSLWDGTLSTVVEKNKLLVLDGPRKQPVFALQVAYVKRGQPITITLAEHAEAYHQALFTLRALYCVVGLFVLAILLWLQYRLLHINLQPLEQLQQQLEQLSSGQLDQLSAEVPSELRALIVEFNQLIKLLEQRLTRSRTRIGNLSHALKTPLALLYSRMQDPAFKKNPILKEQIEQPLTDIQQLVDRELRRARLAGGAQPAQYFDPQKELPDLIETLYLLHAGKSLKITTRVAPGCRIPADRDDILELIGNLLDNACKWARRVVAVNITQTEEFSVIEISDDGPGIPEEARQDIQQRGRTARLDENVVGHGLGLAIVQDIVDDYQGDITLSHSDDLGGLLVTVQLSMNSPLSFSTD